MTGGRPFRIFLAAAVVGGAAVLCFCLGLRFAHDAGGESPGEFGVIQGGTPIAVFSSDPTVRFDLALTVAPVAWTLRLMPIFDPAARPASVAALVVASEGWHVDVSGYEDILRDRGLEVSYRRESPALWLDRGPHDLQLLLVHFTRTEFGYTGLSDIPVGPGDKAVYRTPAGRRIVVPTIGHPSVDCTGVPRPCGVSTADFSQIASAPGSTWFGAVGPSNGGSVRIQLFLYGDWQLGAANPRPEVTEDGILWQSDRSLWTHRGVDFEILSATRAQSSQRNLLWAGILFGIVGSLVASTILALAGIALRSPAVTPPASPTVPCADPCDDSLPPGGRVAATALLILVWIGRRRKRRC